MDIFPNICLVNAGIHFACVCTLFYSILKLYWILTAIQDSEMCVTAKKLFVFKETFGECELDNSTLKC